VPSLSELLVSFRELFRPSKPRSDPSDDTRQKGRENVEEIAVREEPPSSHPWDDPWDAAREKTAENAQPSGAPAPDDSSQGATLSELPTIPEEEPDADTPG
jgi:hypothetical protein